MVFLRFFAIYLLTAVAASSALFYAIGMVAPRKLDMALLLLLPLVVLMSSFFIELVKLVYFAIVARREGRLPSKSETERLGPILNDVFKSLNMKPAPIRIGGLSLASAAGGRSLLPTIMISTRWFEEQDDIIKGVVAHEVIHIAQDDFYGHGLRLDYFRALATLLWNFALFFVLKSFISDSDSLALLHPAAYLAVWFIRGRLPDFGDVGNYFNHKAEYRCDTQAAIGVGKESMFATLFALSGGRVDAKRLTMKPMTFYELLRSGAFKDTHPPIQERLKNVFNL